MPRIPGKVKAGGTGQPTLEGRDAQRTDFPGWYARDDIPDKGYDNDLATVKAVRDNGGGGGGAVDSVNGQTGDVVLNAADVGALATVATDATLTGDGTVGNPLSVVGGGGGSGGGTTSRSYVSFAGTGPTFPDSSAYVLEFDTEVATDLTGVSYDSATGEWEVTSANGEGRYSLYTSLTNNDNAASKLGVAVEHWNGMTWTLYRVSRDRPTSGQGGFGGPFGKAPMLDLVVGDKLRVVAYGGEAWNVRGDDWTWAELVKEEAGITEAPQDGNIYGRQNGAWVIIP